MKRLHYSSEGNMGTVGDTSQSSWMTPQHNHILLMEILQAVGSFTRGCQGHFQHPSGRSQGRHWIHLNYFPSCLPSWPPDYLQIYLPDLLGLHDLRPRHRHHPDHSVDRMSSMILELAEYRRRLGCEHRENLQMPGTKLELSFRDVRGI